MVYTSHTITFMLGILAHHYEFNIRTVIPPIIQLPISLLGYSTLCPECNFYSSIKKKKGKIHTTIKKFGVEKYSCLCWVFSQ